MMIPRKAAIRACSGKVKKRVRKTKPAKARKAILTSRPGMPVN